MGKVRVNITVDKDNLDRAKRKLHLFGGKLSTLFNSYLNDFVDSIDKNLHHPKTTQEKIEHLESRLERLEKGVKYMDKLEKYDKQLKK